ncbi:MAG: endonuclease/exonuclease/phosphatase family protein [Alistipes sp.]|nr:endonuclease/exonuclease/phosphatase family protein [Alistipes sp.]
MKRLFLILALVVAVVTSAEAQKVRVMSYNVRNGHGVDGVKDITRCTDIINDARPDVVAVQELDSMSRRNKKYVLGEMAKLTGYHDYYHRTIPYRGGAYGIGVLTREKALSVDFHPLPCRREPRGLLIVEMKKYYILSTHLSLNAQDRLTSVRIIRDIVSKLNKPAFIAGDMNATPNSAPIKAFKEYAQVLNDVNKFTISSNNPRKCIDYILGTNGQFKVKKSYVYNGVIASDHLPLYVDVKISKPKKAKKAKR